MSQTTQTARILAVLEDGKPHSVSEIHRKAGPSRLNSRISDLRKRGHDIVCERVPGKKGAAAYRYTWLDAPPLPAQQSFSLTTDEIAPRTESQRYRIFRVKDAGAPEIVATVGSREAVGVAICQLGEEGEFDDFCIGVQDSMDRWDDKKGKYVGKWLVLPWQGRA